MFLAPVQRLLLAQLLVQLQRDIAENDVAIARLLENRGEVEKEGGKEEKDIRSVPDCKKTCHGTI